MKTALFLAIAAGLTAPAHAAIVASWSQDEASGNILNAAGGPDGVLVTGGSVDYLQPGVPAGTYGAISVTSPAGNSIGYGPIASDDYFIAGASNSVAGMGAPGSAFTVMSWINPSQNDIARTYRPLSAGSGLGADRGWGFGLRLNDTAGSAAIRFTTYGIADNDSAGFTVNFGEWIHLAATYNNGAIDYYLNGNLLTGSDTSIFGAYGASARLSVGGRIGTAVDGSGGNDSDQVNGLLDGVRIYDSVLSAAEIRSIASQSVSAVPEPAAASLGLAALALGMRRRRA